MAQELTQERLKELLHYDPETGVFTWKVSRRGRTKAGDVAGSAHNRGYWQVRVDYRLYLSHRLAYLYMYGEFPEGKLDHKDRDPGNSRIANLRPATDSQNGLNKGLRANNTSGFVGVSWHKHTQTWRAFIMVASKLHSLGQFENIEDAIAARKEAEIALGVSEFCPQ